MCKDVSESCSPKTEPHDKDVGRDVEARLRILSLPAGLWLRLSHGGHCLWELDETNLGGGGMRALKDRLRTIS